MYNAQAQDKQKLVESYLFDTFYPMEAHNWTRRTDFNS